ncbi:MAG: BlaI/MecI/CopY family transcriptional regulator [Candidatus Marithrix sp.]
MKNQLTINPLEFKVLKLLWNSAELSSSDIVELLDNMYGLQRKTTKTLLSRLIKKGLLIFTLNGREYIYTANIDKESGVQVVFNKFMRDYFDNDLSIIHNLTCLCTCLRTILQAYEILPSLTIG